MNKQLQMFLDDHVYDRPAKKTTRRFNYQLKLLTLVLRRACSTYTKFKLATKAVAANKLDDIVLEYQNENGQTVRVLTHCKLRDHEENVIKIEDLHRVSGPFSLRKYFNSYSNAKKDESINSIILCTNVNMGKMLKDNKGMMKEASKDEIPDILEFKGLKKTCHDVPTFYQIMNMYSIFKRQPTYAYDGTVNRTEVEEFEEKFLLAINQPNEKELNEIIEAEMGEGFCSIDSEPIAKEFYYFMRKWLSDQEGQFITKDVGEALLRDLKAKIAGVGIEGAVFVEGENMTVFGRFFESTENLERRMGLTTHSMIKVNSESPSFSVIKRVQSLKTKHFLALNLKTLITSANAVKRTFTSRPEFTILVECVSLEEVSQARDVLSDLIKSAKRKNCQIRVVLVSHTCNEFIQSLVRESVGELSSFSDFTPEAKETNLKDIDPPVQGNSRATAKHCDRSQNSKGKFAGKDNAFSGGNMQPMTTVNEMCAEFLGEEILNKIVEKVEITIGKPLPTEEMQEVYINRILAVNEKEMQDNVETTTKNKLCIIVGGPGIGKSTELTNMAYREKIQNKNDFVIKMKLLDHVEKFDKNEKFDKHSVLSWFCKSEMIDAEFGKKVLEHHLFRSGRITIYLDGFDEICPHYENPALSFIEFLANETKARQIWVTTRPHSTNTLKELNPFIYQLLPFDTSNRKTFLRKYWTNLFQINDRLEHLEKYADKLIVGFSNSNIKDVNELIGIPLQMKMIADVHEDNCKAYWEKNGQHELELRNMSVYDLFKEFIRKKFDIYFKEKAEMKPKNPRTQFLIENTLLNDTKKQLQLMAFRLLFPNSCDILAKSTKENIQNELLSVGIIQKRNDNFIFIHRTFAEYFAAEFLAEKLHEESQNMAIIQFLISNYFRSDNQMLRYFFDHFLAENSEIHAATIDNDLDRVKELVSENESLLLQKDVMGRIPLHLSCVYSIFDSSEDFFFPINNVLDFLISKDCETIKPTQIVTEDVLTYTPYVYVVIAKVVRPVSGLLAWYYHDCHFLSYHDLNKIEMQISSLTIVNPRYENKPNKKISFLACKNHVEDIRQNNANFKAIKASFYTTSKKREFCKENGNILKLALRNYFSDIVCLKLDYDPYLEIMDKEPSNLQLCQDWFTEAIQTRDCAFLLGITLACPQTAFQLWMQLDYLDFLKEFPKRTNEKSHAVDVENSKKCQQDEFFSDNKLKNILVLAVRQLFIGRNVDVLSAINFIEYFQKILAEDYITFEASLKMMNSEDRSKIHVKAKIGFKNAITIAVSEINPCKVYNVERYRENRQLRFTSELCRDINAYLNSHEQATIEYMKVCFERRNVIAIKSLLKYPSHIYSNCGRELPTVFGGGAECLRDIILKNLEQTLDRYPRAVREGYPFSVTEHIISQIAWLNGNGIPPFINIYFQGNFKKCNFADEVIKEVKRGNIKDFLRYWVIARVAREQEINAVLEANDYEIFKYCLQLKSEGDINRNNVLNELSNSQSFMSDKFGDGIRKMEEYGICLLNALKRKALPQISFLNLFLNGKTETLLGDDSNYFNLLKNTLRHLDHDLVAKLLGNAKLHNKYPDLTDNLKKCMTMFFNDDITVFIRLIRISKNVNKYLPLTTYIEDYKSAVVKKDFERLDSLFLIPNYTRKREGYVEVRESYINYFTFFCEGKHIRGVYALLQFIDDCETESVEKFMKEHEIGVNLHAIENQVLKESQWQELNKYLQLYRSAIDRGLDCSVFEYVYYCIQCVSASIDLPISISAFLRLSDGDSHVSLVMEAVKQKQMGNYQEFRDCFYNAALSDQREILRVNDYEILKDALRNDYLDELLNSLLDSKEKYEYVISEKEIFKLDEYVECVSRATKMTNFLKLARLTEFLSDDNKSALWQKLDYVTAFKNALMSHNDYWVKQLLTVLQSKREELCDLTEFNTYIATNCEDCDFLKINELLNLISNSQKSRILNAMDYVKTFGHNLLGNLANNYLPDLFILYKNEKHCLKKVFSNLGDKIQRCCNAFVSDGKILQLLNVERKERVQILLRYNWTDFTKSEKNLKELQLNDCEKNRLSELLEKYQSAFARGYPWSMYFYTCLLAICLMRSYPIPRCISIYLEEGEEKPVNYIDELRKVIDAGNINESFLWFFLASDEHQKEIIDDKSMTRYFAEIFSNRDIVSVVYLTDDMFSMDIFKDHVLNEIKNREFNYVSEATQYLSKENMLWFWKQTDYKAIYNAARRNKNPRLAGILHNLFLKYNDEDLNKS